MSYDAPKWIARPALHLCISLGRLDEAAIRSFWKRADEAQRRLILWDLPPDLRQNALAKIAARADISGVAWLKGQPIALAYAKALVKKGKTCQCHFMFCQRLEAKLHQACGEMFLDACAGQFEAACCMTPAAFVGANSFIASLGFVKAASLPGAIVCNGRIRAAVFWSKKL